MKNVILLLLITFPSVLVGRISSEKCEELSILIKNGQTRPLVQMSYNKSTYRAKEGEVNINDLELEDGFAVQFIVPAALQKEFGNLMRYEVSGVKVYRKSRLGRTEIIYNDTVYANTFSKEFIYVFRNISYKDHIPSTSYEISFEKLLQIDCNGKQNSLGIFEDPSFSIIIRTDAKSNEELELLGHPSFQLLINNKPIEEDQLVSAEDELKVEMLYPFSSTREVSYTGSFRCTYKILESGCFGAEQRVKLKMTNFPFNVPNDSLIIHNGGTFWIVIDELIYEDLKGERYLIELPNRAYYIKFRKTGRR